MRCWLVLCPIAITGCASSFATATHLPGLSDRQLPLAARVTVQTTTGELIEGEYHGEDATTILLIRDRERQDIPKTNIQRIEPRRGKSTADRVLLVVGGVTLIVLSVGPIAGGVWAVATAAGWQTSFIPGWSTVQTVFGVGLIIIGISSSAAGVVLIVSAAN